jgi:hypothetical protein
MLQVGVDLSRRRVDVCLLSGEGELVDRMRARSDTDGLYGMAWRSDWRSISSRSGR